MAQATTFTAEINIYRCDLTNIYRLNEEIEECKKDIASLRERIMMYAANGVRGVNAKDDEGFEMHPNDVLHREVDCLLEQLLSESDRLSSLLLLKEDYDEETEKFRTAEYC